MDLQYYVLGTKNNTMLLDYLEKYYQLMSQSLEQLLERGVLDKEAKKILDLGKNSSEFIINPDIASLIEYLNNEKILGKPQGLGNPEGFVAKLEQEIKFYLNGDMQSLVMNKGKLINNTNIRITTYDNNPFNKVEAHPDHKKTGGLFGWGTKEENDWYEVYSKTFDVLQKTDEGVYDELNMIIKKIIPLGTSEGCHNSCSYKECVGHLYMGYTINASNPEINNLEAIIHESSHNKLNLLLHFDKIILSDYQEIYYSPYRPDPRHMHGIYLGIHAFAPTIYILLGAYLRGLVPEGYWGEKIVLYHVKNKLALRVIEKYGNFTPLGLQILEEVKYVMALTDEKIKQLNLKKEELENINNRAKQHFLQVLATSKKIVY